MINSSMNCLPDVRFGSLADISASQRDVLFTPNSGHVQRIGQCPLCANSGHVSSIAGLLFISPQWRAKRDREELTELREAQPPAIERRQSTHLRNRGKQDTA